MRLVEIIEAAKEDSRKRRRSLWQYLLGADGSLAVSDEGVLWCDCSKELMQ